MSESTQQKLSRVRKPRVHITYDVETEGAIEKKELPFVVGVMGDFSGDATKEKKSLKDRKFVQIDRDNFDKVLSNLNVGLNCKVDNKLSDDGSQLAVDLKFNKISDFEPGRVVEQVEPLNKLVEIRNQLRDLLSKADRSEDLEKILERILSNTEDLGAISKDLGLEAQSESTTQGA